MNNKTHTIHEMIVHSAERLRSAGIDTPILDAELLLSHALKCSRTETLTHSDSIPSNEIVKIFQDYIERRIKREPLPYITGEREFYGLNFKVTPAVLIPRQETEFLVETAINFLRNKAIPRVIDIGVGSGAIAISIASKIPCVIVYGTDTSEAALEIAQANASRINVEKRLIFKKGDMFEPFNDVMFDVIVSNPPYIPSSDILNLQPEVSLYEPRTALDGGPDGLDFYRRLIPESICRLNPGGMLAVEIGAGDSDAVMRIFEVNRFRDIHSIKDYNKIDRVVIGLHL